MTRARTPEGRPPELYSALQVARLKGVTDQAVRAAIRRGTLPAHLIGGRYLIRKADVERWNPSPRHAGRSGRGGSRKGEVAVVSPEEMNRLVSEDKQWMIHDEGAWRPMTEAEVAAMKAMEGKGEE